MGRSLALTQALLSLATLSAAVPVAIPRGISFKRVASGNSTDSISWGPCPESYPPSVTCATYVVPLDWEHPDSNETIELGMVRIQARDSANRIGNLFMNPGGPGGQATSFLTSLALSPTAIDAQIRDHFDIIGLDPRGVGLSTPVECDTVTLNGRVSYFPKTQTEFEELVSFNKAIAESCRAKTGRLIDFVDTISAIKDHEAVRKALGDEKVTLLGLSYGTQLFSQYAELFPDNLRAVILDGNLQHSQGESSNMLIESSTYEATLKHFFEWCAGTTKDACPLAGQDVQAKFESVLAKATKAPIPAPGCGDGSCRSDQTEEDIRFNVQGYLISTASWPSLGQALIEADAGNATLISRQQPLAIDDAYEDSYLTAGQAIACQDWAHSSTTLADLQAKAMLGATFSPLTKGACQSYRIQTFCIGWPAPLSNPPRRVSYTGDTKILMVQSTFDPSTSYVWGLGLHAEIGEDRSVLLVRNGSGHTSYLQGGETTAVMNAYLLNLTLPEPGTVIQSKP
ncbi:alpha/beta hydrolase fold-domain-containing protein [Hypomontagnella monticulosa]|nr:alpha/beta hydrolase fold-domain-containing protein [Hypomontagnella monticulosa]